MSILSNNTIVDIYETLKNKETLDNILKIQEGVKENFIDNTKMAKIISCALALNDTNLLQYLSLMFQKEEISLMSVLRAVYILDTQRYLKELEKKKQKLEKTKAKHGKINNITRLINMNTNLDEGMGKTSGFKLNGSVSRRVIKYFINTLERELLEKYAISMPNRQWQRLADILHIKKSDFQLNWFSDWIFDSNKVPEDSIVFKLKNIKTQQNLLDIIDDINVDYKALRLLIEQNRIYPTDELKNKMTKDMDEKTYIWYWEELNTKQNDEKFIESISKNGIDMSCGKTIERILTIRNYGSLNMCEGLKKSANEQLNKLKVDLGKVAILGDASASMNVAIKTASIIGCVLSQVCDAEIRLFNTKDIPLPKPKNVNDVIELTKQFKANNATAPAVSLVPYYENKQKVDIFIVVTDEEENTSSTGKSNWYNKGNVDGYMFAELYKKYIEEINPSTKLVFISFTQPGVKSQMELDIYKHIPAYENLSVYKVDRNRPDLGKLEKIIHEISNK